MAPPTSEPNRLELASHVTFLVVPFQHALREGGPRVVPSGTAWRPWWSRLTAEQASMGLDDAGFFLDHVRSFMCPESMVPGVVPATLVGEPLAQHAARLPSDTLLRWTLGPEALDPWRKLALLRPGEDEPMAELSVGWVDAFLFPSGNGFLVAKLTLDGSPALDRFVAVNAQLRVLRPAWPGQPMSRVRGAKGESMMRPLLELFLGPVGTLEEAPAQLVTSVCLDTEGITDQGVFDSVEDRLLFEVATSVGLDATLRDPTWTPGPDQLHGVMRSNRFAPWRVWRALVLKESLTFLASQNTRFTTNALPRNVEGIYLPLALYVLHQRAMLSHFADELVAGVATQEWDLRSIRQHASEFARFRHRFWLSDVTRRPLGGDLYRKLLHGFEVTTQFDLAARAAADVKAFHEERRTRRMAVLLNTISFGFGPLGLSVSVAKFALPSGVLWWQQLLVAIGLLTVIWSGLFTLWRRSGREE